MKRILKALPHLTIVLSLMTLVFFVIDRINRGMAFMTSELSKWVFAALAVLALLTALLLIAYQWQEDARLARRAKKQRKSVESAVCAIPELDGDASAVLPESAAKAKPQANG